MNTGIQPLSKESPQAAVELISFGPAVSASSISLSVADWKSVFNSLSTPNSSFSPLETSPPPETARFASEMSHRGSTNSNEEPETEQESREEHLTGSRLNTSLNVTAEGDHANKSNRASLDSMGAAQSNQDEASELTDSRSREVARLLEQRQAEAPDSRHSHKKDLTQVSSDETGESTKTMESSVEQELNLAGDNSLTKRVSSGDSKGVPDGTGASGSFSGQHPTESRSDQSQALDSQTENPNFSEANGKSEAENDLAQAAQTQAPARINDDLAGDNVGNRRRNRSEKWFDRSRESHPSQMPQAAADSSAYAAAEKNKIGELAEQYSVDVIQPPTTAEVLNGSAEREQSLTETPLAGEMPAGNGQEQSPGIQVNNSSKLLSNSSWTTSVSETAVSPTDPTVASHSTGRLASPEVAPTGARAQQAVEGQSQVDRVRLIQRVARSFSRLGPDGGTVQLRLHPPELGTLSMQVRIEGRHLSANLIAESSAAREIILESLPQLKNRLAEQGYEVTNFNVDVSDSESGFSQHFENQYPARDDNGGSVHGRKHLMKASHGGDGVEGGEGIDASMKFASPLGSWLLGGIDLNA